MKQIYFDIGVENAKVLFIRYNPDEFKAKGKKIDISQTNRLKELENWLKHLMNIDIDELEKYGFCSAIYLFYDNYDKTKVEPIVLLEMENDIIV